MSTDNVLRPLSRDRLSGLLDVRGWHWFIDKDGDLGGNWGRGQFYFMPVGDSQEMLQIMGSWNKTAPSERLDDIRGFITRWHRERLWPKCYHRIDDEGEVRVICDNVVDWEQGATDAQLLQQIDCAISTALDFFRSLEEFLGEN
ncbi:YbjN domain-containing protein [Schaalia sp. ZJ405]|uniref:YbjN domain-containing protein n=1 Tax=unclassified Schaalia TaxID=2691889 RepID=UPI0013EAF55C|nr:MULTISPECIES: YbjN domain-containing protein [unclassified Schaalia]QPK81063.1 YbjN domain-containing protein [Schaalia sp. ZJ405]